MIASHQNGEPTGERDGECDWLAMSYVLGELTDGEAAEFESQLVNDQAARETLARATTLIETLAMIPRVPTVVPPAKRTMRRRIFAALALTAAALCVGLLSHLAFEPASHGVTIRQSKRSVDPARLAVLWVDSAESLNGVLEMDAADESAPVDPQAALLPPDWLLAAVEQEAALSPVGPAFDAEADVIERN